MNETLTQTETKPATSSSSKRWLPVVLKLVPLAAAATVLALTQCSSRPSKPTVRAPAVAGPIVPVPTLPNPSPPVAGCSGTSTGLAAGDLTSVAVQRGAPTGWSVYRSADDPLAQWSLPYPDDWAVEELDGTVLFTARDQVLVGVSTGDLGGACLDDAMRADIEDLRSHGELASVSVPDVTTIAGHRALHVTGRMQVAGTPTFEAWWVDGPATVYAIGIVTPSSSSPASSAVAHQMVSEFQIGAA